MFSAIGKWIGRLMDWFGGERTTQRIASAEHHSVVTLNGGSLPNDDNTFVVVSQRITYRTTYQRKWIPASEDTLYLVSSTCPPSFKERFAPELFEPAVYPRLSNWFLRGTEHPHWYAIHAYLDRFIQSNPSVTYAL